MLCANAAGIRVSRRADGARLTRMDNLQRAGRDFLMRLVAMHGLREVARVLRALTQGPSTWRP